MKKIVFSFLLSTIMSSLAMADVCLHLSDSDGPTQIGNVFLGWPVEQVCIHDIDSYERRVTLHGNSNQISLYAVESRKIRCLGFCSEITILEEGGADGVVLTIETIKNISRQILEGTLNIKAGRGFPQQYRVTSSLRK